MNKIYPFIFSLLMFCTGYTQTTCPGLPVVNYEGRTYNTVQIGSQCWLKENLDVGIKITGNLNQAENSIIEKYCYGDVDSNCTKYGGLYQWNEAMRYVTTPGAKGICPEGWHIPTNAEFRTLAASVSYNGNALKSIGQGTGGGAGTNASGFSALLQGYRDYDGRFIYLGYYPHFTSSSETPDKQIYYICLDRGNSSIYFDFNYKSCGFSVRCIKDETSDIEGQSNNNIHPASVNLSQNYPNPFNPDTRIDYSIASAGNARLDVYDALGNNVANVFNEYKNAGNHTAILNCGELSSGVYLLKLESGGSSAFQKIILMR